MHRRTLIHALFGLAGARLALAQDPASPFRPIAYEDILADSKMTQPYQELKGEDQIIVPPLFRYSLALRTTGVMQPLSERRRTALAMWSKTNSAADSSARFNQQVEVLSQSHPFWLVWQDALVAPYREELAAGGALRVNVLLAGAIPGELLLLAIGYQAA